MFEAYLTNSMSCLIMAKQALYSYRQTGIKNIKNSSAYNVQQAAEYILKYLIYNNSGYNNGKNEENIKQIFTHDIDLLAVRCESLDIAVPVEIKRNAALYTTWEAESRYDVGFSVRTDSLEKGINVVEKWLISIKPLYKRKIQQVNKKLGLN